MSKAPPPPPRREYTPTPKSVEAEPTGWQAKMKAKGGAWGKVAIDKSTIWSDKIGGRVNDIAEKKFGTEHFWPVTGDLPKEMDKCARIIKAFTGESCHFGLPASALELMNSRGYRQRGKG